SFIRQPGLLSLPLGRACPVRIAAHHEKAMNTTPRQQELLKRTFVDYQPMADFARDPLIMERAQGLYYWDIEGKRYFDAIGGIFVATLGHGHPRLLAAMRQQMEKLTFAPPLHAIADVTLEFIGRLGEVTPGNLKYVKGFSRDLNPFKPKSWRKPSEKVWIRIEFKRRKSFCATRIPGIPNAVNRIAFRPIQCRQWRHRLQSPHPSPTHGHKRPVRGHCATPVFAGCVCGGRPPSWR